MEKRDYLEEEIKNFIVNVSWTHKIQVCQYDIYIQRKNCMSLVKIVIASLTSVGLGSSLLEFFPKYQHFIVFGTFCLSFATTIITTIDKENDYEKLSLQNKTASEQYFLLREKSMELLYRLCSGETIDSIEVDFIELKENRNLTNSELPYTSPRAVVSAQDKVKNGRDNDYTEDYEYFIPEKLRKRTEIL